MKKLLLLAVAGLISFNAFSQGMEFFHGTWEECKVEAKKENKKIFIDFYTKWCGPCRAMAKNVFPLPAVGEFYNQHFINYKVDAEVGEGPALAKQYEVKGFPTFIYADAEGQSIYEGSSIGASDEEGFLRLARLALGLEEKTWAWYEEEYNNGNRKTEFLEAYFNARMAEKSMPPSPDDMWDLYNSYPEAERWNGKPLQIAFWQARYGNKFYELVKNNKEKFPLLTDSHNAVGWINSSLYEAMGEPTKLDEVFNGIKADFPTYADQAKELFDADQLRFNKKNSEHVVQMMAYKEKYGEPLQFDFMVGFSALQAKQLKPEHADYIRGKYEEGMNSEPVHFFSVGAYTYLTYKAGKTDEAKKVAQRFAKEAEKYKDSKKSAWAYNNIQKLLNDEAPLPLSY
ncbi:thioredoxin family protein [Carboxylicivirga sp. RSCT41]|uniref:thioredoxin family protein n=1 Tax=Carboxylicivirga agarovorans TaxID=3417570 RepID=UPI003D336214